MAGLDLDYGGGYFKYVSKRLADMLRFSDPLTHQQQLNEKSGLTIAFICHSCSGDLYQPSAQVHYLIHSDIPYCLEIYILPPPKLYCKDLLLS